MDGGGNRQPARRAIAKDSDAVGVAVLAELDVVEEDEDVGPGDLMKIAEPRQIVRLMNGDDHRRSRRARSVLRLAIAGPPSRRSEEHTSELQSLMRISYAVFCLKKKQPHSDNEAKYGHINK